MLEPIGVRGEDEAVYRTLLARPDASERDLAAALSRDPAAVAGSLRRLEELGLVHQLPGRPARLRAARPDVAIDALADRRREELARTQLAARTLLAEMPADERYRPEELVEVLVGWAEIASRFEQLLGGTRHELMVLDRPPYIADPQRSDSSVRALLRANVRVRGIYAPEALELPGALAEVQDAAGAGEQSRVHTALPMKLAIGDRRLAILPLGGQRADTAVCIRPSALLDALVQLFELLWEQATPIAAPAPDAASGDRELALLLASGAKDDVVARRLGTSTRTLSRRIAELMDHLHVRTRFQAGVQAVRLGWLTAERPEPPVPEGATGGSGDRRSAVDGERADDRLIDR